MSFKMVFILQLTSQLLIYNMKTTSWFAIGSSCKNSPSGWSVLTVRWNSIKIYKHFYVCEVWGRPIENCCVFYCLIELMRGKQPTIQFSSLFFLDWLLLLKPAVSLLHYYNMTQCACLLSIISVITRTKQIGKVPTLSVSFCEWTFLFPLFWSMNTFCSSSVRFF